MGADKPVNCAAYFIKINLREKICLFTFGFRLPGGNTVIAYADTPPRVIIPVHSRANSFKHSAVIPAFSAELAALGVTLVSTAYRVILWRFDSIILHGYTLQTDFKAGENKLPRPFIT